MKHREKKSVFSFTIAAVAALSIVLLIGLILGSCGGDMVTTATETDGDQIFKTESDSSLLRSGEIIDISSKEPELVFQHMLLHETVEIEDMAVDVANQAIYFSQEYGITNYQPLNSDIIITQVERNDGAWTRESYMRFYQSGEGYFDVEEGALWIESSGTYAGIGRTISYISWQDEGFVQNTYGKTYDIGELRGSKLAVDFENQRIAVYDSKNKQYLIYDSSALVEGISNAHIHLVSCEKDQEPVKGNDDSNGTYHMSVTGFAFADGYIYQLSGNHSQMYVSVFDLNGQLQYCKEIKLQEHMKHYCMPAAIAVEDGELYVCIQSTDGSCYYANVWKY